MNKSGNRRFYKIFGNNNGKKIYRGSILPNDKQAGSYFLGGVSCFVIDESGNIIIEKRGNTNITKGKLDLCSGHIDNNETPTQAMIREYVEELHNGTQEEIEKARNEAINNLVKLDELDLIFKDKEKERKFFIQFFALKTKLETYTMQESEVAEIIKIPMEELFKMMRQGETKFPYDSRFEKIFEQVRNIYKGREITSNIKEK